MDSFNLIPVETNDGMIGIPSLPNAREWFASSNPGDLAVAAWYAPPERWDLIADAEAAQRDYAKAHPSDGMWDVPPVGAPEPPGGWGWVRQVDAPGGIPVYAFPDPPEGKMYQRGTDGGWWLVDDHGADEAIMRPIVEDAMRRIGMNVPHRAIIPQLRRGGGIDA
jgi:hypothetical protein